jgi:type IV pilus assembly protein PilV
MRIATRHRQGGFSLIELTVATAIYSMGLGSLSLMMLLAVGGTTDARFETTAAMQLSSLAEMILMNPGGATHYAAAPEGYEGPACDFGHACTAEEMAAWQMATWRRALASQLPRGRGLVCRDGSPDDGSDGDTACDGQGGEVIKLFWQPSVTPVEEPDRPARRVLRLP